MRATGSHDIIIRDRLVPAERSVSILEMSAGRAPGSRLHSAPLYRTPMPPILGLAASMPAVGQARAALARWQLELSERKGYRNTVPQAERPSNQIRLARIQFAMERAEATLRQVADEVMRLRNRAWAKQRTRWLAALATAVHQSREILSLIAESSRASAHFETHPLQRAMRDVNTLSAHTVFDLDQRLENYGRTLLGLKSSGLY